MKQRLRLNEASLTRIIRESIKKTLNERVRGEEGMSDDEVKTRRNKNFVEDMDAPKDIFARNSSGPRYSDRLEGEWPFEGDRGIEDKVERDRLAKHRRSQKHKNFDDELDEVRKLKKPARRSTGSFIPRELKTIFIDRIRQAAHLGGIDEAVMDFYQKYKGRVKNPGFTLDNLIEYADTVYEDELSGAHRTPGGPKWMDFDYDFDDDNNIDESRRKRVNIAESKLKRIVAESIKSVLNKR